MKYKTFRNLLLAGVGSAAVGTGAWVATRDEDPSPVIDTKSHVSEPQKAVVTPKQTKETPAAPTSASDARAFVRKMLGTPGNGKVKDALPGSVKVNLYAEDGVFVRAKIDFQRNDEWDESYTFKNNRVSRKPSIGVEAPIATPNNKLVDNVGGDGLRAVDNEILRHRIIGSKKAKDTTKGLTYKVNLYASDSQHVDRAKVDLDRDDHWDEKWTLRGDQIERKVSPNDDENYSVVYELVDGAWRKK